MGMLLTGRRIDAAEAYRIGLVNEVVPAGEAVAGALRWAEEIIACSPTSVKLTKELVQHSLTFASVDEAMESPGNVMQRLFESEDFKEGPRAFAEKRKPEWKNR
jgi:crotonobetainyl-CoA hydratase